MIVEALGRMSESSITSRAEAGGGRSRREGSNNITRAVGPGFSMQCYELKGDVKWPERLEGTGSLSQQRSQYTQHSYQYNYTVYNVHRYISCPYLTVFYPPHAYLS